MEQNTIIYGGNSFKKAMETKDFVYYMDYSECDDNGSVRMYSRSTGALISDNYFANRDMYENLLYFKYEWICKTLLYARKCIVEEHKLSLAKKYFLNNRTDHQAFLDMSENANLVFNKALRQDLGFTLAKGELQSIKNQLRTKGKSNGLSM
tara:strand:+ start:45789 stop:46241 length:453 start_codon:yes stop_codon:yes gene_type:complete